MPSEHACRKCGVEIDWRRAAQSGCCRDCYPRYCTTCDAALPEGRRARYCTDCLRVQQRAQRSKPNRHCYMCGALLPDTWSNCSCQDCNRKALALKSLAQARKKDRVCRDCGAPIGGRFVDRCTDCNRAYRQSLFDKPGRTCAVCRRPIYRLPWAYCKACHRMLARWRRAVHQGDPDAKRLRPVRSYRKLKENP